MSDSKLGELAWIDLSVSNADEAKDFYQSVVGWGVEEVSMGEYSDYAMTSKDSGEPVSGICHAKGVNEDLPACWLPYFLVADVEAAVKAVEEKGGALVTKIKSMGSDKYVVIKDPAGAHCALYQKG